jgi:2-acylglycerol O-acyltransferase 2
MNPNNHSSQVVVMVGGAQEALNARPGSYKLVLKKRKGFIKLAIQTGASIVPVFSFNEVEVYDQPSNDPGTRLRAFQEFCKKWTGIAPAMFIGRGFLQYSFGLIPRRHPVTTVIGRPIETEHTGTPSNEKIDEIHEQFTEALQKLFDEHKSKYLKNASKVKLVIE